MDIPVTSIIRQNLSENDTVFDMKPIPDDKVNPEDIASVLRSGYILFAWYDVYQKYNARAMLNECGTGFNTFNAYEEHEGYVYRYQVLFNEETVILKPSQIYRYSLETISELYENELIDAMQLYCIEDFDPDTDFRTDYCLEKDFLNDAIDRLGVMHLDSYRFGHAV